MNAFQKLIAAAVSLMVLASAAGFAAEARPQGFPVGDIVERPWAQRCSDPKAPVKICEVFQRLEMKNSGDRLAEFAVGFADGKKTGAARGVVILPLGILLEPGISMVIDGGKPYAFKSRYCDKGGCVSYISMDKNLLDAMKNGKLTRFLFRTMNGDNVNLEMKLDGFGEALKKLP